MPLLIEVHLEGKAEGWPPAQKLDDLARNTRGIDQVLAVKFIIDLKDEPAQRPVNFPLRLGEAAKHGLLPLIATTARSAKTAFAREFDRAAFSMARLHQG